jgi:hypothetical protein
MAKLKNTPLNFGEKTNTYRLKQKFSGLYPKKYDFFTWPLSLWFWKIVREIERDHLLLFYIIFYSF